ncbi:MAG: rod shape-determining protein MreC [Candidatus Moranbacteria bacterium]|nr:rod shape-determining protein MreC [Candidatus Moranbacteria bacterium]
MKNGIKRNLNYLVAFVLVVVLLFLFLNTSGKKPLQPAVQAVSAPFMEFFSKAGYWFGERLDFFSSIGELKEENRNLHEENTVLKSKLAGLKDVRNENDELRNQLDLAPRGEYQLEPVLVSARDLSSHQKVLFLNKGEKDGIKTGMPLIVGKGILIGKVAKVFSGSCQAELILNQENKVNAEIAESQTKGIVRGEYGTSVVMDMIPQSAEVERDQTVITSGLGKTYPRGLLIGYTKEAMSTSDQLFQKVTVNLPIEIDDIRVAFVVKGEK